MENEYLKEIERLQACLNKAHKLINPTRLEQSTPGDFLLQLESYVEEAGELSEMVRKWESNYIVERDNAEALRAELDKYRWIPVSERLPDDESVTGKLLLLRSGGMVVEGSYADNYGKFAMWGLGGIIDDVTHWMHHPGPLGNKTPAGDD